jgi:hypothetical protein
LKRAAEGVWGKLLRIQWRGGFLSQRGRVEGLRRQGLVIQWRGEVLSWLGMTAERFRGKLLII